MNKKAYYYIDDTIWALRDLARMKPSSLFDTPLFKVLKTAHDKYGLKTQLNLFYRTDYFYGNDEFTLAEVPDTYKAEWESCSDWLKLAFHAKQEFPDYPHINATYKDIYDQFKMVEKEVIRFAGKDTFTYVFCPHWTSVSKAGTKALRDCGVDVIDVSAGYSCDIGESTAELPYGHMFRLMQNRQPETRFYARENCGDSIACSICSYNHLSAEQNEPIVGNLGYVFDEETGVKFKQFYTGTCLNLESLATLEESFAKQLGNEYIGICNHEQYFYADYFNYQPEYAEKIYKMCEILGKAGYEYMFIEEIK